MGTPAGAAQRSDDFQHMAKLTHQMWQHMGQLFGPQAHPSVDIPVPPLLRKTVSEAPIPAPPGLMDRRSAERALQAAREAAHRAVTRAAFLAGAAGLDYSAPPGFPVDMQSIPKTGASLQRDVRALEARIRAAEQAIAGRRSQSLNRMPSPASMPELQGRRHSAPEAAADSLRRRPSHQQPSLQQPSWPDDTATEDLNGISGSPRASQRAQRPQSRQGTTPSAKGGASPVQRPKVKVTASQSKPGTPSQQGKAKQKAGAKQAAAQEGGGDAWEAAPEKLLRLRVKDVRNTLKERWLQLFWPEDGRWWPGQVLDIRCKERKVHLLYKTGEEETDLDLGELIKKGEVAWLSAEEMMKASEAAGTPHNGGREGGFQQEGGRDRQLPPESPRQRKRPLDAPPQPPVRSPAHQAAPFGQSPPLSPAFAHTGGPNGGLPLEDYDEMDPFEHWQQVQEQQQRRMQQRSLPQPDLLPL